MSNFLGIWSCSSRLLTNMDEVTGRLCLSWDVGLEISIDVVFHFAPERFIQETFKLLQLVRVVGQAEFTDFGRLLVFVLRHLDCVVQGNHVRLTVHPQNGGCNVLS